MGVEGWIHARSVTFTCLDAGQEAGWGRGGLSAEMGLERSPLTFLRTCCSLAEWAFTCLRRELGSV